MALEWVTTPISEDAPSGPDLWDDDDDAYSDYYFGALDRLPTPENYIKPGIEMEGRKASPDQIFDPKSVDLNSEISQIDALLQRSRDIRLLTLRAQISILAADLDTCVESVDAMAALVEAMPKDARPSLEDGPRNRLDALNDLASMGAMILPLRFLKLAGTDASVRRMMVARGEATGLDPEQDLDADSMKRELSSVGDGLGEIVEQLGVFEAALGRIGDVCLTSDPPHNPQFGVLKEEINRVKALIAEAAPSLVDVAPVEEDETPSQDPSAPAAEPGSVEKVVVPATEVTSHDEARARLTAVEGYFAAHEPSSATILLVTQARLLIGKSLIDAFENLMPRVYDRAKLDFEPEAGFTLEHDKLRALANQVQADAPPPPSDTDGSESESPATPATFTVTNAQEATGQIKAVEAYFRAVEKSSPVPMLLARARSYIGKDFEALMREFMPKQN